MATSWVRGTARDLPVVGVLVSLSEDETTSKLVDLSTSKLVKSLTDGESPVYE
jgi:hypothetical protein